MAPAPPLGLAGRHDMMPPLGRTHCCKGASTWRSPSPSTGPRTPTTSSRGRCSCTTSANRSGSPAPTSAATRRRAGRAPIHIDGESVKSCTVLAVQADGADITTIEGLATDGELHPMQQAFMENHGLQCGYCTPGMVMAAIEPARREPVADRAGGAHRARGQPLPLHRLPQHRPGRARRRRRQRLIGRDHDRHRRPRRRTSVIGQRLLRREDPALLTGEAKFTNDLNVPGALHLAVVRSPYAHARIISVDTVRRRPPCRASSPCTPGADLADTWAAPMPCAWPVTDDMKNPTHYPLAVGKACYAGDGVAAILADQRGRGARRHRGGRRRSTSRSRR